FEIAFLMQAGERNAETVIAVTVHHALRKYKIGQPQHRREKPFHTEILGPATARNARVHNGEVRPYALDLGIKIWPDLGFENEDKRRFNRMNGAADTGGIIERAIKNAIHNVV